MFLKRLYNLGKGTFATLGWTGPTKEIFTQPAIPQPPAKDPEIQREIRKQIDAMRGLIHEDRPAMDNGAGLPRKTM